MQHSSCTPDTSASWHPDVPVYGLLQQAVQLPPACVCSLLLELLLLLLLLLLRALLLLLPFLLLLLLLHALRHTRQLPHACTSSWLLDLLLPLLLLLLLLLHTPQHPLQLPHDWASCWCLLLLLEGLCCCRNWLLTWHHTCWQGSCATATTAGMAMQQQGRTNTDMPEPPHSRTIDTVISTCSTTLKT